MSHYGPGMALDLYAGVSVTDVDRALRWYAKLLDSEPFLVTPTEAVYTLAEHRYLVVDEHPEHAGHCAVTFFVDDFDARVSAIRARGLDPASEQTYDNGIRKANYRDPDGNAVELGGAPVVTG